MKNLIYFNAQSCILLFIHFYRVSTVLDNILWLINAASGKETQQTQIPSTPLAAFLCMPQAQINFPIDGEKTKSVGGGGGGGG